MFTLGYSGFTRDSRRGVGLRSPFAKTDQSFERIWDVRDGEIPFSMFPLGYFGHDASAALLKDGEVIACAAEERFTRVKFSLNLAGNTLLPRRAIAWCLEASGIALDDVDVVAHYCEFTEPVLERRMALLRPYLTEKERGTVARSFRQVYEQMISPSAVEDQFEHMTGVRPRSIVPVRHHMAHAASAFYPSGFPEALVFTIDGSGELESSLLAVGTRDGIRELEATPLPTSLGTLYLILAVFLGFRSLGDEYKVMGLASYGDPSRYRRAFSELVPIDDRGTYATALLPGGGLKDFLLTHLGPARSRDDPFDSRHADIAASLQEAVTRAVLHTLKRARTDTGMTNLCMAGGVALNCSLNGALARTRMFDRIFVQPAAGDEGCSVGAALVASGERRTGSHGAHCRWDHAYWGPSYSDAEMMRELEAAADRVIWSRETTIAGAVARRLAAGSVVGFFQGRMEFGPRALGNRSILADPRDAGMKDRINEKVKRRELFRPFAPAVATEDAAEYFDMTGLSESPFMLFTVPVRPDKRALIPAVTHVDDSARVQTVSRAANARFWDVLQEFRKLTGIPVLLNTSFNVRNEPIVCSPEDALACFLSTDIDCMAMGDFLIDKKASR
jgi:carbamoyltransferase